MSFFICEKNKVSKKILKKNWKKKLEFFKNFMNLVKILLMKQQKRVI
uniref:Uncharacterized protein n=1 Tax=viral metagenome TaxID=1070528 RepID=A0A6C0ADS8_9ZZZZ